MLYLHTCHVIYTQCHLILIDCSIFRNLQDVVFIIKKGLIHEYLQNMSKHKKLNQNYTERELMLSFLRSKCPNTIIYNYMEIF